MSSKSVLRINPGGLGRPSGFHASARPAGRLAASLCTVALTLGSAVSCRGFILEDRTDCPAYVWVISEPPVNPHTWEELTMNVWEDGVQKEDYKVNVYGLNRGFYYPATKNSYFEAALLGGWPESWRGDGCLLIPEGEECPEGVGAYFGMEIGGEDLYRAPLELIYLYANVVLVIEGASSGYHFSMEANGVVDGYAYPGSGLHYGPFHAVSREEEYLRREVRIPRLVPDWEYALDNLTVDVSVGNAASGEMVFYQTIGIGKIIRESGYDWSTPYLEDIRLTIRMFDDSIVRLTLSVNGWEKVLIGDGSGHHRI